MAVDAYSALLYGNGACATYESGIVAFEDFPTDLGPIWILGRQYDLSHQQREARDDVTSRLWFTYRKGFSPIGGTGPTTDQGWGCMLRCGQMMLAQALICKHLGREWRWKHTEDQGDPYKKILSLFLDRRDSCYSIHQIAQMGVAEGKKVGDWFGPNTVAQVIRKLSAFDTWSDLAVHVALDNTVVLEDIRKLCETTAELRVSAPQTSSAKRKKSPEPGASSAHVRHRTQGELGDVMLPNGLMEGACMTRPDQAWRPLLLIIPLRLGLNEINSVYVSRLKRCFRLPQTIGVIGGKPNHAHYFIGVVGDELVYLDPHTTQPVVGIDKWAYIQDDSFHCEHASRMPIKNLDPSIALSFYCHDENDFLSWCRNIKHVIYEGDLSPMFEVAETRPKHWPPFEPHHASIEPSFEFHSCDYPEDENSEEDFEFL
ncbi:cysteine protease ATG4B-like isoform X1 [Diadema antillarum]|uniref:cysteine protease ATG4B-like isoform X1 n=1 Tax=Diadema antillarum TaxID=105358 RepID=UPI003A870DB1